jgi:succinate dehydrogenase / fumarate reductase flavoprotein subunit
MARNKKDLESGIKEVKELREEFWKEIRVPGVQNSLNQELEKAGRVADFIELGELMCYDALDRQESCGGHFREEYQTPEGEALRNDEDYTYVAAWEYDGDDKQPVLHKESLTYENIELKQRSYK